MRFATDLANDLPLIDANASDDALIGAIGRRDSRDRTAAQLLHTRHAGVLRAAALAELGKRDIEAADEVVHDVFLGLLFGVATAFQPARDEALPWLVGLTHRTASEHVRAGTLDRFDR